MPELPEVETMRRGILGAVGGKIRRLEVPPSRYRPIVMNPTLDRMNEQLIGRHIADVRRLGKRVLIVCRGRRSDDLYLTLQPKMAGLVAVDEVPSVEHLRLIVHVTGSLIRRLSYWDRRGLGTVHLFDQEQLTRLEQTSLGPDALAIDAQEFALRLRSAKTPIKPAMLQQQRVAGVGNLYASEILHAAGIDPARRCCDLDEESYTRIHEEMRRILLTAIEYEGSTLSDGTYRNALNRDGSYQNSHRVYDRAGQVCLSCGRDTIRRIVQAQRSTFHCPACQS